MDWLETLRRIRAYRTTAFADSDQGGAWITAQTTDIGYSLRIIGPLNWRSGVDALGAAEELMQERPSVVNLYIDSPGGDLFEAMALRSALDTLAQDGTTITARAGGIVASAAVPVFLTGSARGAQDYTRFMAHNPRAAFIVAGTESDIRSAVEDFAGTLRAATNLYWDAISSHVEESTVEGWRASNQDVWLTAAEALEHGLLTAAVDDTADSEPEAGLDPIRARMVRDRIMATMRGRM